MITTLDANENPSSWTHASLTHSCMPLSITPPRHISLTLLLLMSIVVESISIVLTISGGFDFKMSAVMPVEMTPANASTSLEPSGAPRRVCVALVKEASHAAPVVKIPNHVSCVARLREVVMLCSKMPMTGLGASLDWSMDVRVCSAKHATKRPSYSAARCSKGSRHCSDDSSMSL